MSTNVERLKAAYKLWNDEKGPRYQRMAGADL
jgi:hypothetical protein